MLSPGVHHKHVPTDQAENLRFRLALLGLCRQDPRYRAAALEMARTDAVAFIGAFGWQYNPHAEPEVGPFIPYEFQADGLLKTIHRLYSRKKDVVWEKSRNLGASWLALFMSVWLCLLHPRKKVLTVSHTEDAVDKAGDPDSLFWKVQHIHDHLPDWLARGPRHNKLLFDYPATKSSHTGSANTARFGVGGRASSVFSDETGKQQNAAAIISQTRDTGPRLFVSTHYGVGTEFYKLTVRPDVYKIVMHWSQHPVFSRGLYRSDPELPLGYEILDTSYDFPPDFEFVRTGLPSGGPFPGIRSPWYDTECVERASARDVAIHLDIDPASSGWQFYDASTIKRLEREFCRPPVWEGDLEFDVEMGVPKRLVPVKGGPLLLWVPPRGLDLMPEGRYGAGADISEGTGATPSCLSVGNAGLNMKVLEYADANIKPEEFAAKAAAILRLFPDAEGEPPLFAWEMAGSVGESFGSAFMGLGYRNVYYRETPMKFAGMREQTDKPGWYPSKVARGELHRGYRASLAHHEFVNPSAIALGQCLEFVHVAGDDVDHPGRLATDDPSRARDNHGDRVIADALACKMCKQLGMGVPARAPELHPPKPGSLAYRRQLAHNRKHQSEDKWAG